MGGLTRGLTGGLTGGLMVGVMRGAISLRNLASGTFECKL